MGCPDWDLVDRVVVSPGPGSPDCRDDLGLSLEVVVERPKPLLGVCVGHQALCTLSGAPVVRAPEPMHGHVSRIHHAGDALFAGVSPIFQATRYHSLMAVDLPPELDPIAWDDDGLIMAVRHRDWAAWGVQFHPESIASEYGATIVANFLLLTGGRCAASPAEPLVVSSPGSSPVDPSGDSGHGRDLHVRRLELSAVPDPVAAMTALFTTDEQAFWIDTLATDQHERPARYSYIGAAVGPASETVSYRIADGFVAVCRTGGPTTMVPGSIFDYLDGQLSQRSVEAVSPVPLNLGYVGWLGYELRELVGAPHGRCSPHPDAFSHWQTACWSSTTKPREPGWQPSPMPTTADLPTRGSRPGSLRWRAFAPAHPCRSPAQPECRWSAIGTTWRRTWI